MSSKLYKTEKDLFPILVERLKDKGINCTEEEAEEFYYTLMNYIEKEINEKPYCSVRLGSLGSLYYNYKKLKRMRLPWKKGSHKRNLAERKIKVIENRFNKNQPKINSHKTHKNYHIIKSYEELLDKYGYDIDQSIKKANQEYGD